MALVHFVMKSDAEAPPAAKHADYITRAGKYARLDAVRVESGNMPDFAVADPRLFWRAADEHERKNGRAYTELQIALPRELDEAQRVALAREVARDLLGDRFAYTLAVHNPEALDGQEQPHFHLMFSERVIDASTRLHPAERFFKRNGAKKDRAWSDRSKADQVRTRWCELANEALKHAGSAERLDPRSYADQGRVVDALLVEPKMLRRGTPEEQEARRKEVEEIREARAVLAEVRIEAPTMAALKKAEAENAARMEKGIAEIEAWAKAERSRLEKMLAAAKEAAVAFGRWTAAQVQDAIALFKWGGIEDPWQYAMESPGRIRELGRRWARNPAKVQSSATPERWTRSGDCLSDAAMEERQRLGITEPVRPQRKRQKEKGRGGR